MKRYCLASLSKTLFFSLILAFIASACTVKTLYNQLDWLIADHLESYVELNGEQQTTLYKHLDQTLLWHKSSQLPLYVTWLQAFKADVADKPTYKGIEQNINQFQTFLRVLRSHAANQLSHLLLTLTASQRKELYASMEAKNTEFADKFIHISREEQIEQYIDRMEDRFDEWLGSITQQQEALIKASANNIKPIATEVLQTRRRWQVEFKAILETHKTAATGKQAMHDLFVNVERFRSEKYKKGSQHNQQVFIRLIVDVAKTMSKQQQQHFNNKVDNYSRHFTELAEEAGAKLASQ